MLKPTLLALTITTALLTACGGGSGTIPPVATVPPVTTPPVTTPPVITANPPFAFDQHEVTVKAGTSVMITTNIRIHSLSDFKAGTGLTVASPVLSTGGLDPVHVQLTAAASAPTYDIYVIGSGMKAAGDYVSGGYVRLGESPRCRCCSGGLGSPGGPECSGRSRRTRLLQTA